MLNIIVNNIIFYTYIYIKNYTHLIFYQLMNLLSIILVNSFDDNCSIDEFGQTICAKLPKGANKQGKPQDVSLNDCKDRYSDCSIDASNGLCELSPGTLLYYC